MATNSPPPASPAPATPTAREPARAESARSRRRIPALAVGVVGALVAGTYAHFALGMRFGPPFVMTCLGGLTLVLSAFALWRVVDPLTRDEVRASAERRAPLRLRELEREKQTVLKAIKEIELDYQMKKIGETDYREMSERYRARALRVMGELAAGDDYRALIERELKDRMAVIRATAVSAAGGEPAPSPPQATTSGACPACAVVNDPDARFCKRCGVALAATTPPGGSSK